MVGTGAAHHRLVEIVADRILIGQRLEVRRITILDVIKSHGRGSLAGGCDVKICGLRLTIRARSHGNFHPREQRGIATRLIFISGVLDAAIQLLPHLVEAVNRTGGV